MSRKMCIITLFAILAFAASGCGSGAQAQGAGAENAAAAATGAQGQFSRPDLSGEVGSIKGNEITLKVIETPNFRQGNSQRNRSQGSDDRGNGNQGNNDRTQRQGSGFNGPQGQRRAVQYTGETKNITVPSGTSITVFTRGENGRESKAVELKDIKQGDILQVWYSDKDKGIISRITVIPSAPGPDTHNPNQSS